MKRYESPRKGSSGGYLKVFDSRKRRVRGMWERGGKYFANMTLTDELGNKLTRWMPLEGGSSDLARSHYRKLLVQRQEEQLLPVSLSPKLREFYQSTHLPLLRGSGKRPATIKKEIRYINRWVDAMGSVRLNKIRPSHLSKVMVGFTTQGLSNRTINLHLIAIRQVLKAAVREGFIPAPGPHAGLEWRKVDQKERDLYTSQEVDLFCEIAAKATKHGAQFKDYCRFLQYSGCRFKEALSIRWKDADLDLGILTVGAQGESKSRKPRKVNINPRLEKHLEEMRMRRQPDTQWLFPSPRRGDEDIHSKSFQSAMRITREISGNICRLCQHVEIQTTNPICSQCNQPSMESKTQLLPEKLRRFNFHDLRHHFISMCVMSGIDFMTIAQWVGHVDGGVLIGKVYGHLANEHRQRMAQMVQF
jgi:integrase